MAGSGVRVPVEGGPGRRAEEHLRVEVDGEEQLGRPVDHGVLAEDDAFSWTTGGDR